MNLSGAIRIGCLGFILAGSSLAVSSMASAATVTHIAGYVASANSNPTQDVQTTLIVPAPSCNKKFQGFVLGAAIGGSNPNTSDPNAAAGVAVVCSEGNPIVQASPYIYPNSLVAGITVNVGDTVSVEVSETGTSATVTMTDGSQTWSDTASAPPAVGLEVGTFATGCNLTSGDTSGKKCVPVPKLQSKVKFSNSSINGSSLTGTLKENLNDAAGTTQIKSGALSAGGTAFKDKWVSSCTSTSGLC